MAEKSLSKRTSVQVQSFLEKLARTPVVTPRASAGRLIFALDATASREPTWASAQTLQREMFDVVLDELANSDELLNEIIEISVEEDALVITRYVLPEIG